MGKIRRESIGCNKEMPITGRDRAEGGGIAMRE